MLYDPKWQKTGTKADHSVVALVAWLEAMPPDGAYNFHDCKGACLIDLFVGRRTSAAEYAALDGMAIGSRVLGSIACREPHTFGAALERVRAELL